MKKQLLKIFRKVEKWGFVTGGRKFPARVTYKQFENAVRPITYAKGVQDMICWGKSGTAGMKTVGGEEKELHLLS